MFDYILNDQDAVLAESIFGVRIFKNAIDISVGRALKVYAVKKDILHNVIGKKYRCIFQFKPEGKYIRIAPHCNIQNYNISYTNICLFKGYDTDYCSWNDCSIPYKDLTIGLS